jgi:hypothetical protein
MKITLILLLSLFLSLNGNTQSKLIVQIDSSCRAGVMMLPDYEIRKGNTILKYEKARLCFRPDTLVDLTAGNYKVQFKTIFGKKETLKVYLDGKNDRTLVVDPVYSEAKKRLKKSAINQMKDGDSFFVIITAGFSSGLNKDTLVFKKREGETVVSNSKGEIKLTPKQISAVAIFEQMALQVNKMDSKFKCTFLEKYEIHFKNKVLELFDYTCAWNGSQDLIYYELLK